MIGYVKCVDDNKTMSFRVADIKILQKYIENWERVSDLVNIEFYSEPTLWK